MTEKTPLPELSGPYKLVVFTGNSIYSIRKGIVEIDRVVPNLSWLIVVHSPRRTPGRLIRSQWLNLRRNGWRWITYQVREIWQRLKARPAETLSPTCPGAQFTSFALEARANLRLLEVPDIHQDTTLQAVRAFAPDLGLSLAAPILRRPLFSIPRLGTLNLHKGKLPDYRGMPPAFWELWNDEKSVGCTVHWVDDKLDTGNIEGQSVVPREKYSTVRGLQLCLDEVGVDLMRDIVRNVLSGASIFLPQSAGGRTYRKPTLRQVALLDRKLIRNQTPNSSWPRRALKEGASRTALTAWHWGLRQIVTPRITVLLYHRVSDDVRDNLTVGIEQFDRHMALLRRYCRLLSIEQVIAFDEVPKSPEPMVCVTFDDGYLDNYLHATPILLRHAVPAAFFVSTGIVNTDRRFPHDVRRGNPFIPVMDWDQLRAMRDYGFTIGSHSSSHIDCAAEPEEVVRAELARSRDDLRRELNLAEVIFAYPYGGRQHMTPQRLKLVRQAGYSACLSAYGGANIGRVDRFNVLRCGPHWEFSDHRFLLQCLGLM